MNLKGNFHEFSSSNHQCLGDMLVFRELVDGVQHREQTQSLVMCFASLSRPRVKLSHVTCDILKREKKCFFWS